MDHSRVIKENLDTLLRCTNINVYIIACLRAGGGLTEDHVSHLVAEKSLRSRCLMLYEWMGNHSSIYSSFLKVMEENQQEHVVNLLKGNTNGLLVPLSNEKYQRLDRIKPKLLFSIYLNEELVSILESKGALSRTDCEDIRYGKPQPYEKNWTLISAVQRRCEYSFRCLQEALRETKQMDVAQYLERGEMVTSHLHTNRPEIEGHLSEAIRRDAVAEMSSEYSSISDLREHGLSLVSARPDQSILLYFYCSDTIKTTIFAKSYISGRLKSLLDSMLNRLLQGAVKQTTERAVKQTTERAVKQTTERAVKQTTEPTEDRLEIDLSFDTEEVLLIEEVTGLNVLKTKIHPLEEELHTNLELNALYAALKTKKDPLSEPYEHGIRYITSGSQIRSDKDATLLKEFRLSNRWPVAGMAILLNHLYVVYHCSSTIEVYGCTNHHSKEKQEIRSMTNPKDIASCSTNNWIYVLDTLADRTNMKIIKIDTSVVIGHWKVPCDACHISVSNGNVFLSLIIQGRPQVLEYSCSGSLLRAVILSIPKQFSDFQPRKLNDDHFVCIRNDSESASQELFIINSAGTALKSIDLDPVKQDRSSEENQVYLSLDGKGNVLVSDKRANKVWIFDSNLEQRKELISSKHRLIKPDRITLDDSGERLFAMNKSEAMVQVFIIRR